jgi:hypothetical protein
MNDQFLSDIETELDISVESAAAWLEDFLDRIELDRDDMEAIQAIIQNLYNASDFIRGELGIGGEEEDLDGDDYEDDEMEDSEEFDPHLPYIEDDEEEETLVFRSNWDSFRFIEDADGNVTGIQVDFA